MTEDTSPWYPFDGGASIGQEGSERGRIIRDEEHVYGSRITLERDCLSPFSITCGIYGWMFHTRFFGDEDEAQAEFDQMKAGLHLILVAIPLQSDPDDHDRLVRVSEMIGEFVERFP